MERRPDGRVRRDRRLLVRAVEPRCRDAFGRAGCFAASGLHGGPGHGAQPSGDERRHAVHGVASQPDGGDCSSDRDLAMFAVVFLVVGLRAQGLAARIGAAAYVGMNAAMIWMLAAMPLMGTSMAAVDGEHVGHNGPSTAPMETMTMSTPEWVSGLNAAAVLLSDVAKSILRRSWDEGTMRPLPGAPMPTAPFRTSSDVRRLRLPRVACAIPPKKSSADRGLKTPAPHYGRGSLTRAALRGGRSALRPR